MRHAIKGCASTARIGAAVLCLLGLLNESVAQTLQPKAPATSREGPAAPSQAAGAAKPGMATWMVNCTNVAGGFDCRASQTLMARTGQRVLTLAVQRTPKSKKPIMMIQGPLGI